MVTKETVMFITELFDELVLKDREIGDFRARVCEEVARSNNAKSMLKAAQDNLFSVQRKLYAAVSLINDVYRDCCDLNIKTKAGHKRAKQLFDLMRRFQSEYDIHIENTEKGWVAK